MFVVWHDACNKQAADQLCYTRCSENWLDARVGKYQLDPLNKNERLVARTPAR
jgi:hypothetical protein